jgi:hypothetical protein
MGVVLAALLATAPEAGAASGWYELGTSDSSLEWTEPDSGGSFVGKVADVNGVPYVVSYEGSPAGSGTWAAEVGRFTTALDDDPWVFEGDALGVGPAPDSPSEAFIGGVPYIAFVSNTGVHVEKLVSGHWQDITGTGIAATPNDLNVSLTDLGGAPVVAYREEDSGVNELHVKRYDGTAWSELGTGATPLPFHDVGDKFDLAPVGGVLHLVAETGLPTQVKVAKYDSGTDSWSQVGGALNQDTTLYGRNPSVADVGGVPHVVWDENGNVLAKRFVSGAWQAVGGGPANPDTETADDYFATGIGAAVNGKFVVAVEQPQGGAPGTSVFVVRLNAQGNHWDHLSSASLNGSRAGYLTDVADVGGVPVVAYRVRDDPGDAGVYHAHVAAFGQGPTNKIRPQLYGLPKIQQALRCSTGEWSSRGLQFKIVWQRAPHDTFAQNSSSWHAINGAVGPSYTLTDADAGSRIRCLVSAVNSFFASYAPSRSMQADHSSPKLLQRPKVTGDPRTRHTMTCDPGAWTNNPDFTYRWYRDGQVVSDYRNGQLVGDHTDSTYTTASLLGHGDDDEGLTCQVTASNDLGSHSAYADSVHIVSQRPRNTDSPRVYFEKDLATVNPVGQTAYCSQHRWRYDYHDYRYEWLRDANTPIDGAVRSTYTTRGADLGHDIHCRVYSTNPWGESAGADSNSETVPLPQGIASQNKFKTGGTNEFDPVNLMVLSDPYKAAIDQIATDRYNGTANAQRSYCKERFPDRDQIPPPGQLKVLRSDLFDLTTLTQCAILVDAPYKDLSVGYWGVQYTGPVYPAPSAKTGARCSNEHLQAHTCPDLGFFVDPVTPGKEGDLPFRLQTQLAPVTPEHVLWDFNNDHKVDADCPSAAPVVRTLLDKGHYHVHAVIVDKHSGETGVYWNADFDFDHPGPKENGDHRLPGGLRPGQVFGCRTSLEPPPNPDFQGACLTNSHIGRVQVQGNFCPVDLRNLDPKLLDNLEEQSPDVYQILKQMADKRGIEKASKRAKPAHVNVPLWGPTLAAGDVRQIFAASDRKASGFQFFTHTTTPAVAFDNTVSALNLVDNEKLLSRQDLGFKGSIEGIQDDLKAKFDLSRAPFALDQIYLGHGPVKVNGTKLDPTGDYDKQPTLVTPSDAGNVAKEGEDAPKKIVQSMILNNTGVRTSLQGPNGELTLDPESALRREVGDVKDEAQRVLRDNLNVDKYKQQVKDKIQQHIHAGEKTLADELQQQLDALDLGPLKLAGSSVHIDINDDQTATLTAVATIPFLQDPTAQPTDEDQDPTAGGPNKQSDKGAVRVEVTLKGDLNGKLTLQGVHVNLDRADLGVLELHGVDFIYDGGVKLTGDILIPPTREGVRIQDFTVDDKGKFRGVSVAYLAGAGSGIPIGSPVPIYLTSLGGGFHFLDTPFTVAGPGGQTSQVTKNVAKLDAAATFSLGPSPTGEGCAALGMKTGANVEFGGIPVFVADVTGNIEVVCIPIAQAHFHVDSTGLIYITADTDLHVGPIHVGGKLSAGIMLPNWQFSIGGTGGIDDVPFLDDIGVEMAVSNIGLAGCGSISVPIAGHVAAGAGVKFIKGIPPLTFPQLIANLHLFTGCDLGEYKTVLKRQALRSASLNGKAAAAANQSSFTMPAFQRGVLVSLEGAGRAPHVKLKSPSGKVYDLSNATHGVKFSNGIGQIVENEDRSVAILGRPQRGVWTVITAPGSTAVNRIQVAPILPPVAVKGKVTGKGARRTLHYTVHRQAGQIVRFVEKSKGAAKTIGTVRGGGTGKFRYLAAESTSGRRTVVAQVSENGLPRTDVPIAHYLAPNPRIGRPGHVRVRRLKGKALVTWTRAPLAASYTVGVHDSHGGRTAYSARGLRLTIPRVGRGERLTVRVFGVSRAGRRGAPGVAVLKGRHKKKPKHTKHHGGG